MQKISHATMAIIVAVALYFAVIWGYDGLRILSSPSYGLEDVWRSQFIFSIGSLVGLGPIGLIKLAAFSALSSSRWPASASYISLTASAACRADGRTRRFWKRLLS